MAWIAKLHVLVVMETDHVITKQGCVIAKMATKEINVTKSATMGITVKNVKKNVNVRRMRSVIM